MLFDQEVLLWCAAVPALIAVMAAALAWIAASKLTNERSGQTTAALLAGLGWTAAVWVGFASRNEWKWLPEESWQQPLWAVIAAAIVLGGTAATAGAEYSWRWAAAGLLAIATAWLVTPSGEGWANVLPLHRSWMTVVTVSCLLNSMGLDRMARREAHRWLLWVVVAGLAGPFALAAGTFGGLAEWTLASIAATVGFAVIAIFASKTALWPVAFPAVFFSAAITASARFYTYEDHPWWLYGIALFSPSLVALVDVPLRNRSTWLRVVVAAILAAILVGVCVWKGLLVGQDLS